MTQRITDLTKWAWCLLALHSGTVWNPVAGVQIKNPPSNPGTVEAQAKFFQYLHSPTSEDYDQGHRQGSDRHFTERHERSRPSDGLFSAKVRWGDKKGGYGEHYWDLNHAGHNNDNDDGNYDHGHDHSSHDHDDGSYNEPSTNDAYDEPSQQTLTYDNDSYDPEKASQYNERAKRAHNLRPRPQRRIPKDTQGEVYQRSEGKRQKPVQVYNLEETEDNEEESEEAEEPTTRRPVLKPKKQHKIEEESDEYDSPPPADIKKVTLEEVHETQPEHKPQKPQETAPVVYYKPQKLQDQLPYEAGAGVRQHYQAAVAPRLFLEPSTGHVVDRATGQAYVLQPIIPNTNYYIDQ